ncbi:sulfatase [Flammeovirga agarivorans]|uniref:Sulfatase n=1 Tax=Flammeovirga agarivorans TaxID=2726742 RepID=A0A7X8SPI4_9BACT|nr:sulfatase [Flammeovirga agarivorans]NLR93953.1 sulfatase [Flammeovirga agarivorans]
MKSFNIIISVLALTLQLQAQNKKQPNVLFIAIDDMTTELGVYGNKEVISPNIDKLGKEGAVFMNAYCQQALCGPSRLSVMTGMRPETLGVYGMKKKPKIEWRDTRKGIVSIPEQFRKNGYYSAGFGKIYDDRLGLDKEYSWDQMTPGWKGMYKNEETKQLAKKDFNSRPAVEAMDVEDGKYTDGSNTNKAIKFLKNREDKSQPFFLAVGYAKPHLPFVAPKKYWDMYDRDKVSLPEITTPPEGRTEYTLSEYKEIFSYKVNNPVTEKEVKELRHGYLACVSFVDAQIGKLLKALDREGELENTIIVLWGDHGFKLGDYSEWAKATNLELDTRVPFIVKLPKGQTFVGKTEAIVELVDLMPTLCDAAGIETPDNAQGESLMPILTGKSKDVKDYAVSLYTRPKNVLGHSLRNDDWRYTEWRDTKTGEVIASELYDMTDGKIEQMNVVKEEKKVAQDLSNELKNYLDNTKRWEGPVYPANQDYIF